MILIVSAIFFALIFPIFVSVFAVFGKNDKSLSFGAYLYGAVCVFAGKIKQRGGYLFIKHTFNKGKYVPVYKVLSVKKSIKPLNDYHIISLRSLTEAGTGENLFLTVLCANAFNTVNDIAGDVITANKPYLTFRNDLNLIENDMRLNVFIKTVVVFNLLMVLLSFIKILAGKLFYAIKK